MKKIECSDIKISKENGQVEINFDMEQKDGDYNYKGLYLIEKHAIFINTYSHKDKDMSLIVLQNDNGFYPDYEALKCYFSFGIMLSFGRRSNVPESKKVFVTNKNIMEISNLKNLLKRVLKTSNSSGNELEEIVRIIERNRNEKN